MRKITLLVVLVLSVSAVIVGCDVPPEGLGTEVVVTTARPVCDGGHCELNNTGGGPIPTINPDKANSCIRSTSNVAGRQYLCRAVDGYDINGGHPALDDERNWRIRITLGSPLSRKGSQWTSMYGMAIVLHDGSMYEGCNFVTAWQYNAMFDEYLCEYRISRPVVTTTTGGAWSHVLRKAWNWTRYVGNTAGCAGGLAGLMAGTGAVTLPLLTGCVDGPL